MLSSTACDIAFLQLSVPLETRLHGMPGYPVPSDLSAFARMLLEHHDDLHGEVEARYPTMLSVDADCGAVQSRILQMCQYAYYWACKHVNEQVPHSSARFHFLRLPFQSSADFSHVEFSNAENRTAMLIAELNSAWAPAGRSAAPLQNSIFEMLGDFQDAMKQLGLVLAMDTPRGKPWRVADAEYTQGAWRAIAAATEYFAPDGSYVLRDTHAPYQAQWRRIALELLDMFLTRRMPDFRDPEYYRRAFAPSGAYRQAILDGMSR